MRVGAVGHEAAVVGVRRGDEAGPRSVGARVSVRDRVRVKGEG